MGVVGGSEDRGDDVIVSAVRRSVRIDFEQAHLRGDP